MLYFSSEARMACGTGYRQFKVANASIYNVIHINVFLQRLVDFELCALCCVTSLPESFNGAKGNPIASDNKSYNHA